MMIHCLANDLNDRFYLNVKMHFYSPFHNFQVAKAASQKKQIVEKYESHKLKGSVFACTF